MTVIPLRPLVDLPTEHLRYGKMDPHVGTGRLGKHGDDNHPVKQMVRDFKESTAKTHHDPSAIDYEATAVVPTCGQVLIFLRDSSEEPSERGRPDRLRAGRVQPLHLRHQPARRSSRPDVARPGR